MWICCVCYHQPQILIRSAHRTLITHINLSSTVRDVKQRIRSVEGFAVNRQVLKLKDRILDNNAMTLRDGGVVDGSCLQVAYFVRPPPKPSNIYYAEFIKTVTPDNGAMNVPLDQIITVEFSVNSRGFRLCVDAFIDAYRIEGVCIQDMVEVLGERGARQRGFRRWTTADYSQRFFLLEVSAEKMSSIDSLRYHWGPLIGLNGSYYGGDLHSWQRYTTKLPVKGTLRVSQDSGRLAFNPLQPLLPLTTYAIVFANGVPVASPEMDMSSDEKDGWGMCEDKLFFFQTTSAPVPLTRHNPSALHPSSMSTSLHTTPAYSSDTDTLAGDEYLSAMSAHNKNVKVRNNRTVVSNTGPPRKLPTRKVSNEAVIGAGVTVTSSGIPHDQSVDSKSPPKNQIVASNASATVETKASAGKKKGVSSSHAKASNSNQTQEVGSMPMTTAAENVSSNGTTEERAAARTKKSSPSARQKQAAADPPMEGDASESEDEEDDAGNNCILS